MNILQVNKYNYFAGGSERYYIDVSNLLKRNGHKVAYFSMQSPKNHKSIWNKYFSKFVPLDNVKLNNFVGVFLSMVYSNDSRVKIARLMDEFKPDIVHIHNIYNHISPSILYEIRKRGIPVVYTLHDYHLITPNYIFFHNGNICEKIKGGNYLGSILHKCVRGSLPGTILTTTVFMIHSFLGSYSKNVNLFISPSLFLKNKMVEYGYDSKKIIHLPNFINKIARKKVGGAKSYVLYFGQIYEHKGIFTLVEVAKLLPHIKFKIAGTGPDEKKLKQLIKSEKINNIELLGFLNQSKLSRAISNSNFVIVPSLWYENMPYSILEAFANGKPVIASKIGGIPEIVRSGKNGFLFRPGNSQEFANKIQFLWDRPKLVKKFGLRAKSNVEDKYNPETHYNKLMGLYKIVQDNFDGTI